MRKTKINPIRKRDEMVPKFFHDVKFDNFGWIGNKLVCHDYGHIHGFINYKNLWQKAIW